ADFAAAHGKPISFGEFATDYNDGAFIHEMGAWIKGHNTAFAAYWDTNDNFNGNLDGHPVAKAAFAAEFGGTIATPTPTPTPHPAPTPAPAPPPAPVPAATPTPTTTGTRPATPVPHPSESCQHGEAEFA